MSSKPSTARCARRTVRAEDVHAASRGRARVAFDEAAWEDDLRGATSAAQKTAEEARTRLERDGQPVDALLACDNEAADGTNLSGCVKVYLPPPAGPWGLVYLIARDDSGRLYLDHLAFGQRHPTTRRRVSVYQFAHRRLHDSKRRT
jgi:hypothetical protein